MNGAPPDEDWRGYWLGRLDDDAAARLECRLLADDRAVDALREALTDLHDDGAREQLTVAEHAAFRDRVLRVSAEARARQRFAQAMKPLPEAARRTPRPAAAARAARRPSWTLLAGALIAAALALTLSLNRHWLAPAADAGGAAVPVRDAAAPTVLLLAPPASGPAAPVQLALDPRAVELRVQAEIRPLEPGRRYRLRVLATAATDEAPALFEATDLPVQPLGDGQFVEARVPAPALLGETRRLRVDALPPAAAFHAEWTVLAPVSRTPPIALPAP